MLVIFFFQAEDGIRDLVRSRGLGDVYKRQGIWIVVFLEIRPFQNGNGRLSRVLTTLLLLQAGYCLLYTSDAADERSSVDLGGRRIIKKKKHLKYVDGALLDNTRDH